MTTKNKTTDEDDPWADGSFNEEELSTLMDQLDNPLKGIDNSRLCDAEQHRGFDRNVGETWIYPSNLPCRSYQMSIVQAALYRNTLVVLPTGLGKTFIAAVVMYNLYRWYPKGKVIFMAPTRPLVNQQIEACQNIMPFPRKDTVELTGRLPKAKRAELWKTKRVFFATPQVVQSDIIGSNHVGDEEERETTFEDSTSSCKFEFPFDAIKLIVVDEAHKAKGKYSYVEVVQAIASRNRYFRVVALSATPGRTMDDVAEVCRNLLISHIEVRCDNSVDVVPYVHKRSMETVVVSLGERIKEIREELLEIIDPYLRQLIDCQMLSGSLANINRNFLLYEQKRYHDRCQHNGRHPQHSAITSNFSICVSLYHSLELLERHGLRVFLNNFEEDEEGKSKFVIQLDRRLRNMVDRLNEEVGPNPFNVSAGPMTNGKIAEMPKDLDFGHPKFEKARECLLKHFQNHKESRAIVFCEYRESVLLIYRMLLQHVPLLKPKCFVGQGGTGNLRPLTQKQQIQIMNDFRSGQINILIATSIGEEGIDVGEVDLIVCFDISTSNPTRFVQRIGRTGRKKNGNVVMLVTEGREQQILKEVLNNKDQTNKKILRSSAVQHALYKQAPRLVPTDIKPQCVQTFVTPYRDDDDDAGAENEEMTGKNKKATGSKQTKKGLGNEKGVQDLRKFFNKKPIKEMDAEDLEYFEIDTKMTQAKPGVHTQQRMERSFDRMKNLFKDMQSPQPTQLKTQKHTSDVPKIEIESLVDLCDVDSSEEKIEEVTPKKRQKLMSNTQSSIACYFKDQSQISSLCDQDNFMSAKEISDQEIRLKLNEFFQTNHTTADVIKRAKINDLSYHLKSEEMSDDMKYLLLTVHQDYLRQNLEQMKILNALQDFDNETAEEKNIREINGIIIRLFGGLEKADQFLEESEMEKFKRQATIDEISSEEESESEGQFKNRMDDLFAEFGEPLKSSETFDWVQEKYKQTRRYKEEQQARAQSAASNVQESMVYNTFVDNESDEPGQEEETNDVSFTDSKYCSQWLEFNKPDMAFKSTPLQGAAKKTSYIQQPSTTTRVMNLLNKLEESKGEEIPEQKESKNVDENSPNKSMLNSKFLDSLLMCEKELNTLLLERKKEEEEKNEIFIGGQDEGSSSRDTDMTTGSLVIPETEMPLDSKVVLPDVKEILSSTVKPANETSFAMDEDDGEEDEMFLAALEAEMRFTQSKENEKSKTNINSPENLNKTADDLNLTTTNSPNDPNRTPDLNLTVEAVPETCLDEHNSSVKLTPPSLNSTPDIIEFKTTTTSEQPKITSNLPTPPEISLEKELDFDMEAFLEPFPEEEELLKSSHSKVPTITARRESHKENLNKETIARQSPDLFAEEHMKSPNLLHVKPIQKISLASKLSAKLNLPRSHSAINPSTSSANIRSPHKNIIPPSSAISNLTSPSSRKSTNTLETDKSPSLFDMYLKAGKGRVKLPSSLRNTSSSLGITRCENNTSINNSSSTSRPPLPATQDESILVVRKRPTAPKRKIFDSDSGDESSENDVTVIAVDDQDDDSDFEQIAVEAQHWM
ncbi:FA complementation group M isoform X2 [Musca autumnalis]|uniref:FA complementation group M isoform X2 n=1 Tax=Musca autumnalis TaxID=221902 RepID=UPI003CEEEB8C